MRPRVQLLTLALAGSVACAPDSPAPTEPPVPLFQQGAAPAAQTSEMEAAFAGVNAMLEEQGSPTERCISHREPS